MCDTENLQHIEWLHGLVIYITPSFTKLLNIFFFNLWKKVRKFFIQKLPKLLFMRVPTPSAENNRQEQPSQSLGPGDEGAGGAVNENDEVKRRNIQVSLLI